MSQRVRITLEFDGEPAGELTFEGVDPPATSDSLANGIATWFYDTHYYARLAVTEADVDDFLLVEDPATRRPGAGSPGQ